MMQVAQEQMTPEQFVYWLQGFIEMADPVTLTEAQTKMLKEHLALVFNKQTSTLAQIILKEKDLQVPYLDGRPVEMPVYVQPLQHTGSPIPQPPYTVTCSADLPQSKFIC